MYVRKLDGVSATEGNFVTKKEKEKEDDKK
jgi:hypothetical protein